MELTKVRRPVGPWPWLLLGLATIFALVTGWSVQRAGIAGSRVLDRDYYSHGLKYNQTMLEKQAAAALGWQLVAAIEGERLTARLHDQEQRPVSNGEGRLLVRQRAGRDYRTSEIALAEVAAGVYETVLPAAGADELDLTLIIRRDRAEIRRRLLVRLTGQ